MTGVIVTRYRIRILGSSFRGWTTGYLGFNLREGVSRRSAVEALLPFVFRNLRCMHLELRDRQLTLEDVGGPGFAFSPKTSFVVDLRPPENEIFARMKSNLRRAIRKAEKVGVAIEEADDLACGQHRTRERATASQTRPAVEREGAHPTRAPKRESPAPTCQRRPGKMHRDRDLSRRAAYFRGGASWREHNFLRPSEAVIWYAMRYWKARGIEWLDLGGGADYKRKYGTVEVPVPFFRISRFRAISAARHLAKRVFRLRQAALGRVAAARIKSKLGHDES